ncbi:MAG: primosomal protein N' [Lachnospiraceae bacterium]|nr:primosomal protein N' [Lachnospiraceae bacterium]
MLFADVIVDISHENLDKVYQYKIKPDLNISIGTPVNIPFGRGNKLIFGYVVGISETPNWDVDKIKYIDSVVEGGLPIQSHLIELAYRIKDDYGGTMIDALKTVIPIKKSVKSIEKKYIQLAVPVEEAKTILSSCIQKNYRARIRLLSALLEEDNQDYHILCDKLNISYGTVKDLEKQNIIQVTSEHIFRNPVSNLSKTGKEFELNGDQREAADTMINDYKAGICKTYLLHGITGSGKTEVYMEVIEQVVAAGQQAIMLIPEIALTYQTVSRFYKRFGDRVSILHSKMSQGERYDQYVRAKEGQIDIMIGPRSALFTPFSNLGLIIVDEEHEDSYKSDNPPKYHAREVAVTRAKMLGISCVLGSATPSLESFYKAKSGEYQLLTLGNRAGKGTLPQIWVEDLREELKHKNYSILSRRLKNLIADRLRKQEQIMLFINRRGYAGFVSCRSCGHVLKCPHCDVSLTYHNGDKLCCHYCGYEEPMHKKCPECGSPFIAAFGTGTQKVEEMIKKEFRDARVLRMDADTTARKDGHNKILSAFANHEADILVGTQMIVKGHDFKEVTLVGILAADMALYADGYRGAEKTFQMLSQASGRAGRDKLPGEVVVQTYNPEHYAIIAAQNNDYTGFYEEEMLYRQMLGYPPASHMMVVFLLSKEEEKVRDASGRLRGMLLEREDKEQFKIMGPAPASLSRVNDYYRFVMYVKCPDYDKLKELKNYLEGYVKYSEIFEDVIVQFDFDPTRNY